MISLPKRSLLLLSIFVFLEIAWVSAHAQLNIEGDQNPQAALTKRTVNHKLLGAQQDFARSHSRNSIKRQTEPEAIAEGSEDTHPGPKIPADYKYARPMAWKRSASEDSPGEFRYARPMAWKTKRAVGGVPESGSSVGPAPSTVKEKRAVGTVPDSGSAALDTLKPMRRASVLEKREERTVKLPGSKNSPESGRRLVARDNLSQAGQLRSIQAD